MQSRLSLGRLGSGLVVVAGLSFGACSDAGTASPSGVAGAAGQSGSGAAGSSGTAGASASAGVGGSGPQGAAGTAGASAAGAPTAGAATAGASGSAGAAGATGNPGAMPSEGCGTPAVQALMTYVKTPITVTGVTDKQAPRNYYLWLPEGYDPKRAYPLVFIGPGCGSDGMHGIQIQSATGKDAIIVGLDPSTAVDPGGRQCFDSQTFPDPEVPYFDQTLKAVESKLCVDKSKIFIEGFSSGSWLANLIGCVDAGTVIRGQGNASGCMQGIPAGTCTKPVAYFEAHNDPDPNNSYQCGTQNRDEKIKRNGCTTQTMPYTPVGLKMPPGATIDCVQYVGCMKGYPVIFCTTKGLNPQHNPQDDASTSLTTAAMWNFWTTLPSP